MWIYTSFTTDLRILFFFSNGRLLFRFLPNPITCGGRCFSLKLNLHFYRLRNKNYRCAFEKQCVHLWDQEITFETSLPLYLWKLTNSDRALPIYLRSPIKLVNTPHGLTLWVLSRYYSRHKSPNGLLVKINKP